MTGANSSVKATSKNTLFLLIVDDSELTRMNFKALLALESQGQLQVVGEAQNGLEALELAQTLQPDVVLMDVGMPIMDGVKATQQLKASYPDLCIVMLTSREEEDTIVDSFRAGARSYCLKETEPKELVSIIQRSYQGGSWIDPKIARFLVAQLMQPAVANAPPASNLPEKQGRHSSEAMAWVNLSERELEVLSLMCQGSSNARIAEQLCISMNTVKTHSKNIYQKLGVDDRTSAVLQALKEGLV